VSLGRLELPLPASEASALSTELQGHLFTFYHVQKSPLFTSILIKFSILADNL
jgi:hypothetical protein